MGDPSSLAGLGLLLAIVLVWAIYLGYPLISVLLGYWVNRKLRALGKGNNAADLGGTLTAMILLLLPFVDYPSHRHRIDKLCSGEGGFHIKTSVRGVEGVHGLRDAFAYGYSYGEDYWKPGDPSALIRFYAPRNRQQGGLSPTAKVDKPSSFGFRRDRARLDGSVYRVTLQTYRTDIGEELGRFVYFENVPTGEGLSIDSFRKWMHMTCNDVEVGALLQMRQLLQKTLIPIDTKAN